MQPYAMIESPRQHQPSSRTAGRRPRVALAHDWLCGYRGGKAVLERIAGLVDREFEPAGLYVIFDDGRPLMGGGTGVPPVSTSAVDRWRAAGLITAPQLGRRPAAL